MTDGPRDARLTRSRDSRDFRRRPREQPTPSRISSGEAARSAAGAPGPRLEPARERQRLDGDAERPRPHRERVAVRRHVLDPHDEVGARRRAAGRDHGAELRGERGQQRRLPLGVVRPEPGEVALEVALGEEQGERPLLERPGPAVRRLVARDERLHRRGRDDRAADPQARVEHLRERPDVEDAARLVQPLERRLRVALVAQLASRSRPR